MSAAGKSYGIEVLEGPDAGTRIRLARAKATIGRGQTDVVLHDADVSRLHAMLEIQVDGSVLLRDLGSTNGIYVGSKRVAEWKWKTGESVRVGQSLLRLAELSL